MVEVPWDKVQRECGLKLFGLVFLREEILSWRRHYPEVLKLMVNKDTFVTMSVNVKIIRIYSFCPFSPCNTWDKCQCILRGVFWQKPVTPAPDSLKYLSVRHQDGKETAS